MIYAVIAAGGIGSRMGKELPKQYLEIKDKPIIAHTVQKFIDSDKFARIIILCPAEWCDYTNKLLGRFCNSDKVTVLEGGTTRNDTVMNAISFIKNTDGLDSDTVIVTHDAVRPFVTDKIISDHIEKSVCFDAIGTVIPATDTIIVSNDGLTVDSTPDRSKLYQCQTPQTFKAKRLYDLYNSLSDEQKGILTDSCSIFTVSGLPVHLVTGDVQNIKITYPYDLKVAKSILE